MRLVLHSFGHDLNLPLLYELRAYDMPVLKIDKVDGGLGPDLEFLVGCTDNDHILLFMVVCHMILALFICVFACF